mgnify:FL=1
MALLNGIFNTGSNPTELNMRSFAASILRLFPAGSAPIFALSSQLGKTVAKSSTHGYFSKTMTFLNAVLGAGVLVGATTIVVPSTTGFAPNMVLHNTRSRENVLVTDVNTATLTLTVVRGYGRIAAAAMNAADILLAIGTSFAEGSVRPAARGLSTVHVPNYTQIFRNAWGLTDTARASMAEAGYSNIAENRADNAMFHSADIEAALIWGQAKMDTISGSQPLHATQGIRDAIAQYASANITQAGATTTMAQLETMLTPMFRYSTDMSNPTQRVIFCDQVALKVFNQIGRLSGQVFLNNEQTTFGMKFTSFVTFLGTCTLVQHPLMNGLGTGANNIGGTAPGTVSGTALVMDMPALKLAYLEGRDTKAEEYGSNGKAVELGLDGVGGSLTTELAVELVNPYSCGIIEGLIAGAQ